MHVGKPIDLEGRRWQTRPALPAGIAMLFGEEGHVTLARVKWTMDPTSSTLQHMGIDHGGTHVLVSQEFLHRPDIIAVLQQMRSETMAERFDIMLHLIDTH
jgi:hypothetical protein